MARKWILILWILGVLFCFNWRPWVLFTAFQGAPLWVALLSLIVAFFIRRRLARAWHAFLAVPRGLFLGLAAGTTFLVCALMAYFPLDHLPHVTDEFAYLWGAREFAQGQLFSPSHELPEFFNFMFFINDGRWFTLFQPGWPLVLSLGVPFGLEWLISPILGAVAIVLAYFIGLRTLEKESHARFAVVLLFLSPMHTAVSSLMLSHELALVLTEIAVLCTLRLKEKDRLGDALTLGLAIGWLFATRALNGALMGVLLGLWLLPDLWRRRFFWPKLYCALPALALGISFQFYVNQQVTGSFLEWPQDTYFNATEPKRYCHNIGFGTKVGCPIIHPGANFPEGYTVFDAVGVTHLRMGTFLLTLFGFQAIFIFIGMPFWAPQQRGRRGFLLAVFLAHIIGYFAFYFHGFWGRYYHESAFAIFLLLGAGLIQADQALGARAGTLSGLKAKLLRALVPGVVLAYTLFNAVLFWPQMMTLLGTAFFSMDARLDKVKAQIKAPAVVFVENWYQTCFRQLAPGKWDDILYVNDLEKENRQMMQFYPTYNYYHYNPQKHSLTQIKGDSNPDMIFVEAEKKTPIWDTSHEFAYEDRLAPKPDELSGGAVLSLKAKGSGSHMAFRQFIFKPGRYTLTARFLSGPKAPIIRLSAGMRPLAEIDLYAEKPGLLTYTLPAAQAIALERGQVRLAFTVLGKNAAGQGYDLSLDWLRLDRQNAPAASGN